MRSPRTIVKLSDEDLDLITDLVGWRCDNHEKWEGPRAFRNFTAQTYAEGRLRRAKQLHERLLGLVVRRQMQRESDDPERKAERLREQLRKAHEEIAKLRGQTSGGTP